MTTGGNDPSDIVRVDYAPKEILIHATSTPERKWRARSCKREPWTVKWLEENVRSGDIVYDVGANVGVYSLIAGALLGDQGLVFAFEPGFASYARLCENIVLNGFGRIVVPLPLLLSSTSGLQAFSYRDLEPGQSRHHHDPTEWDPVTARGKRYVQPMLSAQLDEAQQLFGLHPPDLIKIDVDGGELEVLKGSRKLFGSGSMRSVLIEIDKALWHEVATLVDELGYKIHAQHGSQEEEGGPPVVYAELRPA